MYNPNHVMLFNNILNLLLLVGDAFITRFHSITVLYFYGVNPGYGI